MTPEERAQTIKTLRVAAARLLGTVQLPEEPPETVAVARSYLDSLSNDEKKIINHLAGVEEAPAVYGSETGNYLALIKTEPSRSTEETDLGRVARSLLKADWLRFEEEATDGGYYWLTDRAVNVLKSLGAQLDGSTVTAAHDHTHWKHDAPKKYVDELIAAYGEPAVNEGDIAVWGSIAGFDRVFVMDEEIAHDFPGDHIDFAYSTKKVDVPEELVDDLVSVSGSIIVDVLKKEVTARCAHIIKNAVTIGFVEDVVAGRAEPTKDEYARRINNDEVPDWYQPAENPEGEVQATLDFCQALIDNGSMTSASLSSQQQSSLEALSKADEPVSLNWLKRKGANASALEALVKRGLAKKGQLTPGRMTAVLYEITDAGRKSIQGATEAVSPKEAMDEVMTTREGGKPVEQKVDDFLKLLITEGQKLNKELQAAQGRVEKMYDVQIPNNTAAKVVLDHINKRSPWGRDAMSPLLAKLIANGEFVF